MTPLGSMGVGWLGGSCRPPTHVPLVEPWSTAIIRSSMTVACCPLTAPWAMTSDARAASRPTTTCPGGGCSCPGDMIIIESAGCARGTGDASHREDGAEIERHRLLGCEGRAIRRGRSGTQVDEKSCPFCFTTRA